MANEEFIPVAKPVDVSSYPMKTHTSNTKHVEHRHQPVGKSLSYEHNRGEGDKNDTPVNNKNTAEKRPMLPPSTMLNNHPTRKFSHDNLKLPNDVAVLTKAPSDQTLYSSSSSMYSTIDTSTQNNAKTTSLGKESRVIGKPQAPTYTTVEKNNMDVKKGILSDAKKPTSMFL